MAHKTVLRTALLFGLFGILWIVVTDRFLLWLVPSLTEFSLWQTVKGWIYVFGSTLLLYLLLLRSYRRQREAEAARQRESERFRRLAENTPDLLYRYNFVPEPHFSFVSDAALAITGYSPADHYADPNLGFKLIHPDDRHLLELAKQGELTAPIRLRWIRKDGKVMWAEQRNKYIYDANNNLVALEGMARDVTEHVEIEMALRESEKRFRRAIVDAPFPVMMAAEDGEVLAVSSTWTEITGYELAEMATLADWTKRAYGERQEEVMAIINRLFTQDGHVDQGEFTIRCKDGRQRIWDFRSTPLGPLPDGRRCVVSMAVDVTERKQAEKKLEQKSEELDKFFSTALDLLCIADMNGRFLRLNPQWEKVLGYSLAELQTGVFLDFVHPEDRAATEAAMVRLEEGEQVIGFINRYRHRDGSYRWIEWRSSEPIAGLVYAAARNITSWKETTDRLRLQAAALEAAADAIVITDIDGQIEWANTAFTELTDYTLTEALGQNLRWLVKSSKEESSVYEEMWQTILAGEDWRGEIVNRRKDGSIYIEEETITPVLDEEGVVSHFIAIKKDISARKQNEAERENLLLQMRQQADQLSQIMRSVPEGVCLLDRDGKILVANPQAQTLLLPLAGAAVGDVLTLLGGQPLDNLLTSPPQGEWHEVTASGRHFQIRARLLESGPVAQGWALVLGEVTEQRQVRQQLQQQERLAAVGQLAAGIAHDFNNILAVITLYAQLLTLSSGLDSEGQSRVKIINDQAMRAATLVQQILDFSRQSILEPKPIDFLPLLKEQTKLLKRTLPESIEIDLKYSQDNFYLKADPARLQQVIMNLALNARDAMPEGGQLLLGLDKIEVDGRPPLMGMKSGVWLRFRLKDTGTGIPADVLDHIFEPFFTTKEPGKGNGLGLAQVHGIVGQQGGFMTVDSQLGEGTTFVIYLPSLELTEDLVPDAIETFEMSGQGERLLVVEDNDELRAALVATLREWTYEVVDAADGQTAVKILQSQHEAIDLIISDVVMPRMSGTGLLRVMDKEGWRLPVILMSGHPRNQFPEEWPANVVATLTKPVDFRALAQTISRVLAAL